MAAKRERTTSARIPVAFINRAQKLRREAFERWPESFDWREPSAAALIRFALDRGLSALEDELSGDS